MDDESGWEAILVQGWGPLVRAAVADRVVEAFAHRPGVLVVAAIDPDEAEAEWVEAVHVAVAGAIAAETGADIEALGSQAAWATYDDVWGELARRSAADPALVVVPDHRVGQVHALLTDLPPAAALHAGAVPWPDGPHPLVLDGRTRVHLDGLFRWLATEPDGAEGARALARALVAVVRDGPPEL